MIILIIQKEVHGQIFALYCLADSLFTHNIYFIPFCVIPSFVLFFLFLFYVQLGAKSSLSTEPGVSVSPDNVTAAEAKALSNPSVVNRDDVIVAALLHDIGHICCIEDVPHMVGDGGPDVGVIDHEHIGGYCCQDLGFSEEVAQLVASHVTSKRYLTHIEPQYHAKLAADSTRSLTFQGGPMTGEEAVAYEQEEIGMCWKIKMRHWDDLAKTSGAQVPAFDTYRELIIRTLQNAQFKA